MTNMIMDRERRNSIQLEGDSLARQAFMLRDPATAELAPKARLAHVKDFRRPRVSATERLRQAIEHGGLSLHYQPQYQLRDGRNCGVEALARWFLPDGEAIPPVDFIPRAEKHGLIAALGAWVLGEACSTVAGWRRVGQPLPILCVNVSPRQISREFCAMLETTLERTGFPPELLELEITEGILIEQPQLALDCLAQWKRLGVRIALDDFGVGYSSLSYLSRLPVDRLKIDKSLTHRMTFDSKTAAIVRAIISLGADLGLDVLAEGVETESQLAMLSRMGCQQAQGYLLAMPKSADDARALSAVRWGSRSIPDTFPNARRANASLHAS